MIPHTLDHAVHGLPTTLHIIIIIVIIIIIIHIMISIIIIIIIISLFILPLSLLQHVGGVRLPCPPGHGGPGKPEEAII